MQIRWLFLLFMFIHSEGKLKKPITFLLDPAGDVLYPGRRIRQHFERTVTLNICHELKKELEKKNKHILVLFTRFPGEAVPQLEKARFANQFKVHLYIRIQCFATKEIKPQLYIYYFNNEPMQIRQQDPIVSIDKAHYKNLLKTKQYIDNIKTTLTNVTFARLLDVADPQAIPCLPLKAIEPPALLLEIGLKQPDDWVICIGPFCKALEDICTNINS